MPNNDFGFILLFVFICTRICIPSNNQPLCTLTFSPARSLKIQHNSMRCHLMRLCRCLQCRPAWQLGQSLFTHHILQSLSNIQLFYFYFFHSCFCLLVYFSHFFLFTCLLFYLFSFFLFYCFTFLFFYFYFLAVQPMAKIAVYLPLSLTDLLFDNKHTQRDLWPFEW